MRRDPNRPIPVIGHEGTLYSGFHQGAGETVLAELVQVNIPQYSILLIDEVESSLHPKLQRRLIRDLAELARVLELQIVLTTHSPIILDELPIEARAQIMLNGESRTIVYGMRHHRSQRRSMRSSAEVLSKRQGKKSLTV